MEVKPGHDVHDQAGEHFFVIGKCSELIQPEVYRAKLIDIEKEYTVQKKLHEKLGDIDNATFYRGYASGMRDAVYLLEENIIYHGGNNYDV